MYPVHPDTMFQVQEFHRQELLAEAAKARLIKQARRSDPTQPRRHVLALTRLSQSLVRTLRWRSAPSPVSHTTAPAESLR